MKTNKGPLKLALHGMDARAIKVMMMFLSGPCQGAGNIVINADDADVDIFDADSADSKKLLESHSQKVTQKPVIVFSVQAFVQEKAITLKKPIKADEMLLALVKARKSIKSDSKKSSTIKTISPTETTEEEIQELFHLDVVRSQETPVTPSAPEEPAHQATEPEKQELKTFVSAYDERKKTSKHLTAKRLDEKGFHDYIGIVDDVDVNDPAQISNAHYDPANYFQGTVQAAIAACRGKNQIFSLESNWKPITIFPTHQEVWIDGSDAELKVYAGVRLKHRKAKTEEALRLTVVDPQKVNIGGALYQFQSLETFLWKLACWTSMGRYPKEIDYTKPVYLKNWPNFTRLLITPHALRIAALLVHQPRTMASIAQALNIKPQYVFIFISAAYAIGLAGQSRRAADALVEVLTKERSLMEEMTKPRSMKQVWLLGSIMSKLRS